MKMKTRNNTEGAQVAADLVDVVLGGTTAAAHAAERIGAIGGWQTALALAARWHVLPALAGRLGAIDPAAIGLQRAVGSSLRAQTAMGAVRSAAALCDAELVLRELAEADVPAAAFKGVATIATLYRCAALRMVSDVDVVIRPSDLARARAALADRGYADHSPPFERHVSDIILMRTLQNFSRTYVRNGFEIDLHWQFGQRPPPGLRADRILERAVTVALDGHTLLVAGPIDTALLLVHHVLRAAFEASTTVKDLLDLAAWWSLYGSTRRDELVEAACETGLASSLLALTLALAARDPGQNSAAGIAALERRLDRSGRAQARALRASFEDALRGGAPDSATIALFAPKVYARSLWGTACREIASKPSGALSRPAERTGAPNPIVARVPASLSRIWRIGRELAQFKRIGTYRAVARAQSRFH
jgi:hypothetical protein